MKIFSLPLAAVLYAGVVHTTVTDQAVLDACPGYKTTSVNVHGNAFTANLELAGKACNVFGQDIENLKLEVEGRRSEVPE